MRLWAAGLALLGAGLATGQDAAEPQPLELRYPHAGVAIRLPAGFEPGVSREPLEVLRARRGQGDRQVRVVLSAYPVDAAVTADAFADAVLGELKRNPAIRNFKVLGQGELTVAGLKGTARRVGYTRATGEKVTAVRAFFVHQQDSPRVRVCYLLRMETPQADAPGFQATFEEITAGVSLLAFERIGTATLGPLGPPQSFARWGFSLRAPLSWYAVASGLQQEALAAWRGRMVVLESPVELGQSDYLAGGRVSLRASVVSALVPAGMSARDFLQIAAEAKGFLRGQWRAANDAGRPLGDLAGHQVLWRRATREGLPRGEGSAAGGVVAARGACLADPAGGPGRAWAILLRCDGPDADEAAAILNVLAEGFALTGGLTAPGRHGSGVRPNAAPPPPAGADAWPGSNAEPLVKPAALR